MFAGVEFCSEIAGVDPPEDAIGAVPVTELTPPDVHPVVVAPPLASVQSVAPVPATVPELRRFVSVPWMALEDVTVLAVAAIGTCVAVMPDKPFPPVAQVGQPIAPVTLTVIGDEPLSPAEPTLAIGIAVGIRDTFNVPLVMLEAFVVSVVAEFARPFDPAESVPIFVAGRRPVTSEPARLTAELVTVCVDPAKWAIPAPGDEASTHEVQVKVKELPNDTAPPPPNGALAPIVTPELVSPALPSVPLKPSCTLPADGLENVTVSPLSTDEFSKLIVDDDDKPVPLT